LELDLSSIKPCIAGPKRPQDKVLLEDAPLSFQKEIPTLTKATNSLEKYSTVENHDFKLAHGDIVIAALTSCTNTSNPSVMIAAGLVAKKANALGVTIPKWVKTSLAPGSQVVSEYFEISGLQIELDKLGFQTVGYGCATCIGNSGPLNVDIANAIAKDDVIATSVLSGNRNFEGRVHPSVKANYLASPPLVIAYAIAGNINVDLANGVIAKGANGRDVYLKDIWPTNAEIWDVMTTYITSAIFKKRYASVFTGDKAWQDIHIEKTLTYGWNKDNTYINNPPYFHEMQHQPKSRTDIENANILAIFGDSITTDHISPAGDIAKEGPSAHYLESRGVNHNDFNSYGARRGNHEVMIRGTFANIRIKNEIVKGVEGGFTKYFDKNSTPSDKMPIFDAATKYQETQTPLIIFAGKEYGTGSSRDWAAKGTRLLGVKAVVAESFERIHRSNLIGMGVLPLVFMPGENRQTLKLEGNETISIHGLNNLSPKMTIDCKIKRANGDILTLKLKCCIDTYGELTYFNNDGILPYVLRNLTK
jgi:aconitate hydratase